MVNPEKQPSLDDRDFEGMNSVGQAKENGFRDSTTVEASGIETSACSSDEGAVIDEGDDDLLVQQGDGFDRVIQFLQALDLQVMGACRADERLKPLLKLNNLTGAAEDCLLARMSQHFEPSEVGMLARCLCVPLVSIRVGKINKLGTLLCPTASRGNLNLTLLPTSDLRFSFIGDEGYTERLLTLSSDSQCSSSVAVEEIPADMSQRSFLIRIPDGEVFYFWCSEKSLLLGNELLTKMKDLLKRKPSLAELTGISESRLDCFATHLRTYLVGSTVTNTRSSTTSPSSDSSENFQPGQFGSTSSKPSRARSQSGKGNSLYQGSLSPRSSSFKEEGMPRNFSFLRSAAREKVRRRDIQLSVVDELSVVSAITKDVSMSNHSRKDKLQEEATGIFLPSSNILGSLVKSVTPPFLNPTTSQGAPSVLFSPYYCWCPPVASAMQYTLPITSPTESFSLPPLSSLLSAARSSTGLNVTDFPPPMDFPSLLPDPLVRSCLQQIPTFTPLMCDPIVHIPFLDVCSSGQGYLVSAGPAISTNIPSLHPTLVNPLDQQSDPVVENGARETLRLLISSSSQTNQQLMNVFPSVLTSSDEIQSILVTGSRGFYTGAGDVTSFAKNISTMGLFSLSEKSLGEPVVTRSTSQGNLVDPLEKSCAPVRGDAADGSVSKFKEEAND